MSGDAGSSGRPTTLFTLLPPPPPAPTKFAIFAPAENGAFFIVTRATSVPQEKSAFSERLYLLIYLRRAKVYPFVHRRFVDVRALLLSATRLETRCEKILFSAA
jgi:hypothetical protein